MFPLNSILEIRNVCLEIKLKGDQEFKKKNITTHFMILISSYQVQRKVRTSKKTGEHLASK